MKNRMVRDAIVLRSQHPEVQGKCFEKGDDLTMEMVIKVGQDDESSRESLSAIGCGEDAKIHGTGYQNYKGKERKTQEQWSDKASSKSSYKKRKYKKRGDKDQCRRCGYEKKHKSCPAQGKTCKKCKGVGHFAQMCFFNSWKPRLKNQVTSTVRTKEHM